MIKKQTIFYSGLLYFSKSLQLGASFVLSTQLPSLTGLPSLPMPIGNTVVAKNSPLTFYQELTNSEGKES